MTRLGLSDSMRSDVALEATEPLHTASHRRLPRRSVIAPPAATASNDQETARKATLSKPLRIVLGGVLCVFFLVTGLRTLSSSLRAWTHSSSHVVAQFEQLERRISMLGRDTTRLKTTADAFLKRCQQTQVAASTRTEMVQTSAKKSFNEQAKTQLEEHQEVVKEVMQYYAQQEQKLQETRERLREMNVTLPVQITVRSVPESWQKDNEQTLLGNDGKAGDRRGNAMEELSFIAEKSLHRDASDGNYQRLSVEHISIETSSAETQATSHGSIIFVFYAFVISVSAGYMWSAVSESKKKELMEDKWSWSPVPKALGRLKALLSSVVVIEDLRETSSDVRAAHSLEHIEHIEF